MTGTEDITSPPINSFKIAEKIPGAWLIQIQGGGHGVIQQYPDTVNEIIETYLSNTRLFERINNKMDMLTRKEETGPILPTFKFC